ncbi:MAG TPA: hypothetical protein VL284_08240 [Thermoanaerobaculia bacterium]|nr:hypothetical protein [Thermoanaerobaculia bacterium]
MTIQPPVPDPASRDPGRAAAPRDPGLGSRDDWIGACLLIALPTLFFADVLFLGNNFFFRDLFAYHFPMKHVLRETIARGEFPWWNPYFGGGQPMAANPAYELWYPPQWLIFVGTFAFGFALHILFHVYLALLGMYAFLRSIPLRVQAATFGALSFGFSGFLLGTITNLPTFFVWSWAGVIGWAVLRRIRGGSIAPAALAMAMPLLVLDPAAVPQLFALVIAGTLVVDRRALPRVIGAILLSVAIAAVAIVPAIDHAHDSVRARGFAYGDVIDYSMPPVRIVELILPRAFGLDLRTRWLTHVFAPRGTPYLPSIYCGVAVAILAIAGFLTRQRGAATVAAICAISYVLAIGGHTPLFSWLYAAGLRSLRYPEKFIAAGVVTLIVFASVCVDRIDSVRRAAIGTSLAVAAALLVAGILVPLPPFRWSLLLAAFIAAAWALAFWERSALIGLALLVVDVAWFSNQLLPREPRSFFTPPPIVKALEPGATLFHRGMWAQPGMAAMYERRAPALSFRNSLRPLTPALWNLRLAMEGDIDETYLQPTHDLLDAMQTHWNDAYLVASNVRYVVDFKGGGIDHPILVTRIPNRGRYWCDGPKPVSTLRETSSTADLDVEGPCTLFITITMHKYWHASIDGRAAPLQRANIAYQSLAIPAGRHRVALRYRNPLIVWSGAVSAIALIALIPRRRRPRSAP